MSPQKLIDLHTHTDNSPDGHHSTMFMCETAMLKGIRAIAFTDHYDLTDEAEKKMYARRSSYSYFETSKARTAFTGKLLVLSGVELGEAVHDLELAEKIVASKKYDIVLGSIHNLRNEPDFKAIDYSKADVYDYLTRYFDEVSELSRWNGCDVIAHLTCPLRYITGRSGIEVELGRYSEKLDEILKNIIDTGKALEVNTSELLSSYGKTMPHEEIIRRYKQLGGDYITVGSDAHYAPDVGKGIPQAIELIKSCGFNRLTFFQHRNAMQVEI